MKHDEFTEETEATEAKVGSEAENKINPERTSRRPNRLRKAVNDDKRSFSILNEQLSFGTGNKALCPYHDDKTPSLQYYEESHTLYCFGCNVKTDIVGCYAEVTGQDENEAVLSIAMELGMDVTAEEQQEIKESSKRAVLQTILRATVEFYHKNLTREAKQYLLEKRKINSDTINSNQIGHASGGLRGHLINFLKFEPSDCIASGVLAKKIDENGEIILEDFFNDVIIFPNWKDGATVSLTGRNNKDAAQKYKNLPGSNPCLYLEDYLKNSVVYLAEGIPDTLTLIQAGYAATGLFGASTFKPTFLNKFENCERVYLCVQNDLNGTGLNAFIEIAKQLREKAYLLMLPDAVTDINDYFISHSKEEFDVLVSTAKPIFDLLLSRVKPQTEENPIGFVAELKEIKDYLRTEKPTYLDAYLSKIQKHFGLKSDTIRALRAEIKIENRNAAKKGEMHKQASPKMASSIPDSVDLVHLDNKPAFLILRNNTLSAVLSEDVDGTTITPPPGDQMQWILPEFKQVETYQYEKDSVLFDDIYHKLIEVASLPTPQHYVFLAGWVMATYLQEKFEYFPIITFFAVPERGKSRMGKAMIFMAYNGLRIESLQPASLLRMSNHFSSSMFFDVVDIMEKMLKANSEDILINRFEKDILVQRVMYPDRGDFLDTVSFKVFGPTIIATNKEVNEILGSRSVMINMPQSDKAGYDNEIRRGDFAIFRGRLIAFRARHMNTTMPQTGIPANGRLGSMMKTILQVIKLVRPEQEAALQLFINQLQDQKKREKSESEEGDLLRTITNMQSKVANNMISFKDILAQLTQESAYQWSPRIIGSTLTSLGFISKRAGKNGGTMLIWDVTKLNKINSIYGIENASVASVASVNSTRTVTSTQELSATGGTSEYNTHISQPPTENAESVPQIVTSTCGQTMSMEAYNEI
jgi:DNA primase catalytic core